MIICNPLLINPPLCVTDLYLDFIDVVKRCSKKQNALNAIQSQLAHNKDHIKHKTSSSFLSLLAIRTTFFLSPSANMKIGIHIYVAASLIVGVFSDDAFAGTGQTLAPTALQRRPTRKPSDSPTIELTFSPTVPPTYVPTVSPVTKMNVDAKYSIMFCNLALLERDCVAMS